jgi:hypothetical protein
MMLIPLSDNTPPDKSSRIFNKLSIYKQMGIPKGKTKINIDKVLPYEL